MSPATVTIYSNLTGFRVVLGEHKAPEGAWHSHKFESLHDARTALVRPCGMMQHRASVFAAVVLMMKSREQERDAFALAPSPLPKRKRKGFVAAAMLAAAAVVSGCAALPSALYLETEHTSHPLAGEPFGPADEEDGLTVANAGAEWVNGNAYLQSGFGWKLAHEGMKGPDLTFNIRAGYRFNLKVKP